MHRPSVLAPLTAIALAVAVAVGVAGAQTKDNSIDPGMSKAQVVEHLGPPQSAKTADSVTYLYYKNGCEKTCGMNDIVILQHDKVVDAIFRDPARHYTGKSSSPTALTPAEARKKGATKPTPADTTNAGAAIVIPAPRPAPAPPAPPASAAAAAPPKADSTSSDSAATKPPGA